jgi:hypothetical protein
VQSGTVLMFVVMLTTSYLLCPVGLFVALLCVLTVYVVDGPVLLRVCCVSCYDVSPRSPLLLAFGWIACHIVCGDPVRAGVKGCGSWGYRGGGIPFVCFIKTSNMGLCITVHASFSCNPFFVRSYMWNRSKLLSFRPLSSLLHTLMLWLIGA